MFTQTATSLRPSAPSAGELINDAWLRWSVQTSDERAALSVAEMAECRCPDLCDRDHANE